MARTITVMGAYSYRGSERTKDDIGTALVMATGIAVKPAATGMSAPGQCSFGRIARRQRASKTSMPSTTSDLGETWVAHSAASTRRITGIYGKWCSGSSEPSNIEQQDAIESNGGPPAPRTNQR